MLYTGKGDNGTTSAFGCDQRFSKSSAIAEALGTLDEVNSFLGVVKVKAEASEVSKIISDVQQNLFTIQAEVAGAEKHIGEEKARELGKIINAIETELPPIKTFFVSGGTELASLLDLARALSRRAERRVVGVADEGAVRVGKETLAYLNRLSSLLYALARQTNYKSGITEEPPMYQ
ncbi:MAG: ATP:cob(I)alamin adenosyltransferase [Candidatus Yonathbacteria bacterium CG17_big_fil_post_rev_8_21_14_2_50_43_9]|uniref:Corrinoid adenosyltransferase n=1 Tax=Candidatus Yonathbacteria bacterium CG_4_10_14_0_8_um_filter_43_17 TaxID=1975099 RepID=A0A2M7Q6D0_9BACT|nr:MAG: ATP:cob(I)alamin adenosyltransferase [Candidatus Yonathbacteria bacterium CG17_big_fil_post_rev_8_21_14_2_50_43_9]PIY58630.1 MAG: ATP:cob(I)alamin adenosyltransferase [Candidatus Yonathbacteria bacterium CG_4_10_14_0_8_um_filter_43_17]